MCLHESQINTNKTKFQVWHIDIPLNFYACQLNLDFNNIKVLVHIRVQVYPHREVLLQIKVIGVVARQH